MQLHRKMAANQGPRHWCKSGFSNEIKNYIIETKNDGTVLQSQDMHKQQQQHIQIQKQQCVLICQTLTFNFVSFGYHLKYFQLVLFVILTIFLICSFLKGSTKMIFFENTILIFIFSNS